MPALPIKLLDWDNYDFIRSVIERRANLFLRGFANDWAFFRALKTQLGSLSEWEKRAAMLAGMYLRFDEYKNWLAVAPPQSLGPFAGTYIQWLRESHGRLKQILSEPHELPSLPF